MDQDESGWMDQDESGWMDRVVKVGWEDDVMTRSFPAGGAIY